MNFYQDHILDHYHHPRNAGSLEAPTHRGTALNPLCGDQLSFDLEMKNGVLAHVAWSGSGCAISQAAASLLSELIVGKSEPELWVLRPEDILKLLGLPLSPARLKCGILSLETLHQALNHKI